MDPKLIAHKLNQKKVKDYTFIILFFFLFSFFLVAAIRPNIVTAFRLRAELEELKVMNTTYEDIILQIVDHQSLLEASRDKFYLLEDAIPKTPQVYKLVDDIKASASVSGTVLNDLQIQEIPLKSPEESKELKNYLVTIGTSSDINKMKIFVDSLVNQRRLKSINNLDITLGTPFEASISGTWVVNMEIQGYYSL